MLCTLVGLMAGLVVPAAAQELPRPAPGAAVVAFSVVVNNGIAAIPSRLSGKPGEPEDGKRVMMERTLGNCLSCHEVNALRSEPFHGEIGPSLDGVARRWDVATLRMIVVNAKKVFGGDTVMPAFYRIDGLNRVRPEFAATPILTAQQVEDVVAFLATLK